MKSHYMSSTDFSAQELILDIAYIKSKEEVHILSIHDTEIPVQLTGDREQDLKAIHKGLVKAGWIEL